METSEGNGRRWRERKLCRREEEFPSLGSNRE